jgi:hypothetical protein
MKQFNDIKYNRIISTQDASFSRIRAMMDEVSSARDRAERHISLIQSERRWNTDHIARALQADIKNDDYEAIRAKAEKVINAFAEVAEEFFKEPAGSMFKPQIKNFYIDLVRYKAANDLYENFEERHKKIIACRGVLLEFSKNKGIIKKYDRVNTAVEY